MKLHFLGHATMLIETADCNVLFDPVLGDEFGEACFAIRPPRRVLPSLPAAVDVVVISHRHLDHFDVRSLARLPRAATVLVPEDPLLTRTLARLGFTDVHAVDELTEIEIGRTVLLSTRSELRLPEHGWVVATPEATLWNQVDTIVSLSTIVAVRDRFPRIDLLLTPWQPMLEMSHQTGKGLRFPHREYGRLLDAVAQVGPRAVAPGANGFEYLRDAAWLNDVVFPADRERFCRDVVDACPSLAGHVLALEPGDVLALGRDGVARSAAASPFVERVARPSAAQRFCPVSFDGRLVDDDPFGFGRARVEAVVAGELGGGLERFVREHLHTLFRDHARWCVRYALHVVFPDRCERLVLDLDASGVSRVTDDGGPAPNYQTWITASALCGLATARVSWDAVAFGGRYRSSSHVYRATPHGLVRPTHSNLNDPLFLRFPEDELLDRVIDREVDEVLAVHAAAPAAEAWSSP